MVDTMNDDVRRIEEELEPLIFDLDDKLMELRMKKENLERVSRMLAYVNGDVNMVGIYADQDLIMDNLDKISSNKDEYKASCYLLSSEDDSIRSLPQYRDANLYILSLINYFKMYKSELNSEIQELEEICRNKEMDKKYYELLKEDNPFILDIKEYIEFVNKHTMNDNEKINLLKYAIKSNVANYQEQKI